MTKTGQTFEMNPDTFTLENVFAMELHRFQVTSTTLFFRNFSLKH